MSENLNEPQSRTEEILQNALGEEYDVTPQSRVEKLLEQVVEGGGSGSSLPSPTTSDNGKVLGVDGGEYKLVNARSDIPKTSVANVGKVLGVTANGGIYAFVDKDSPVEKISFNGAFAYKTGNIAYVTSSSDGITFPPISQGGLTVQYGELEVAELSSDGSVVLAYVRDSSDPTKRYKVASTKINNKTSLFLVDADTKQALTTSATIWDNFCIPCK